MKLTKLLPALLLTLCFTLFPACSTPSTPPPPAPPIEDSTEEAPEEEEPELPSEEENPIPEDEPEEIPEEEEEEEEEQTPTVNQSLYIECIYGGLNIRSGAGTAYFAYGKAEKGTLFPLKDEQNGWYTTVYKGKTAYLSANAEYTKKVVMPLADERTESVIDCGTKQLGVKYVYGAVRLHDGKGNFLRGFTPSAFDCSSLMQYVFYYGASVNLQVTTRTQVKQGVYVAPSLLQRGDCIYFTNSARAHLTGVERVGHVALYLGDGYILHTASDYCKIEKMSATRWNYYIEARRFI